MSKPVRSSNKRPSENFRNNLKDPLVDYVLQKSQRESLSLHQSRLLQLPRKLRVLIWQHCHYRHFKELRSTCKTIANDIDNYFGISARVDEREAMFDDNFDNIGIRHATIVYLASQGAAEKLKDPNLLVELSIAGPISTPYFTYFMESCQNISSLTLNFTAKMLSFKRKGPLFPQTALCLPKLKTLRVYATTKKEKDLIYICDNITALINGMMESRHNIVELHIMISYRTPSPFLDYIVVQILILAQKNNSHLQQLHIQARESIAQGGAAAGEGGNSTGRESDADLGRRSSGGSSTARRATDMVKSKKSLMKDVSIALITAAATSQIISLSMGTSFDPSNASLKALENYLAKSPFSPYPFLNTAMIVVNSHWFPYAQSMLEKAHKIRHLQLEACDGVMHNCWLNFEAIVKTTRETLTVLKLFNVSYEDGHKNPLDLDFSVFKYCKSLKHFFFSSVKRENKYLPKAKNISCLPKTLVDIEIWWATISAWQWFKLLRNYKKMESLRLAYTTTTVSSFGWFLFVLRWMVKLKLTKVETVVLTDFKIKFRDKRAALKKLRKAINIQIQYRDDDETFLVLDRCNVRHSEHSIPSIADG